MLYARPFDQKKLCQSDQKILSDLYAILPTLVVVHAHHRDFRHNLYLCIEALHLKRLCLLSNCLIFIYIDSRRTSEIFYMRQRNPDVANDFELVSQQLHLFKLLLLQRSKKKIMNFLINKNFCPPVAILFFFFRLFSLLLQIFSLIFCVRHNVCILCF